MKQRQKWCSWYLWCWFYYGFSKKDINLFNKLAENNKVPVDLGRLISKKFKKGIKLLGNRSYSTSIVKLIENECNIKLRAKNYPKQLIDKNSKKGIRNYMNKLNLPPADQI